MAKYLDKTPDEWELLTEKWHEDETITDKVHIMV